MSRTVLSTPPVLALVLAACGVPPPPVPPPGDVDAGEIRLLVRGDDMGAAHGMNEACMRAFRDGIVRSVEVIVPGPWFREAAALLREASGIDVGVHLDLTSEWDTMRWGPIAPGVPSLVDRDGKFHPMTRQRAEFPPGTGFLECGWKIDEVERELRAQIELALEALPAVTHLSAHMGTATSTPELRALVERLAAEYGLPIAVEDLRSVRLGARSGAGPAEKEEHLVRLLEGLEPGLWLLVTHPGVDTAEMRALGHIGYRDVAADRAGDTRALTSSRVREVIRRRGIRLVSYGAVLRERGQSATASR